jgi:photosystem I subunit 3
MAAATMAVVGLGSALKVPAKQLSSQAAVSNTNAAGFVKNVSRTVCSAESSMVEKAGKAAAAVALAAVVSTSSLAIALEARADVAGLTPCKESKAFEKRKKQELKKLSNRLKLYEEGSAPALALQATAEKTEKRFAFYASQGLLCGDDGYPHMIVSGDLRHLGEFVYPGIVFLYIAGWIGWVGREYLIQVSKSPKPTEKEIIIDVPLAVSIMGRGFTWPVAAVSQLRNGTLTEVDSKITVSPR